jgi:hydrogenase maturation factor
MEDQIRAGGEVTILPVGKLPAELLAELLSGAPTQDPRLLLGPGVGLDCAVIEAGESLLVLKSDPITFTADEIGWYAVQINANDIATTGAIPRWFLATVLLPQSRATVELVRRIAEQLFSACREIGVTLVGGHTEITYGIERPIVVGMMIGEVNRNNLVTPRGAQTGDRLLLTKSVPIEATAILGRELGGRLSQYEGDQGFSEVELAKARNFLHTPGISVLREAQMAVRAGMVHAMHDPTEGGLYTALWELAQASGHSLTVDLESVPVDVLSRRICQALNLDALGAIASGSLLLAAPAQEADKIRREIQANGIACTEIGKVLAESDAPAVFDTASGATRLVPRLPRDEIARLFE